MNNKPCRENGPDPDALAKMKSSRYTFPDTRWAAYENHDLGHRALGHLKFLAVGAAEHFQDGTGADAGRPRRDKLAVCPPGLCGPGERGNCRTMIVRHGVECAKLVPSLPAKGRPGRNNGFPFAWRRGELESFASALLPCAKQQASTQFDNVM
jgi:hypothetical protein